MQENVIARFPAPVTGAELKGENEVGTLGKNKSPFEASLSHPGGDGK